MPDTLIIARYEFIYHLKRPLSLLLALLIVGEGLYSGYQLGFTRSIVVLPAYSAAHAYQVLSSLGIILTASTALLAGTSISKDWEQRTASYLYCLPISASSFLMGRFSGTLAFVLILALGYPVGFSLLPLISATALGPAPYLALLDGYLFLTTGHIFTLFSVAFSLTVLLRSQAGAYLTLSLSLLILIASITKPNIIATDNILAIFDPFGSAYIQSALLSMPTLEQATELLVWPDGWYINRLLWLAISLALLHRADNVFTLNESIHSSGSKHTATSRIANHFYKVNLLQLYPFIHLKRLSERLGRSSLIGRLTLYEIRELSHQPLIWVICVIIILLTLLLGYILHPNPEFVSLPTTATMTALRQPLGVLMSLFLMLFTGEWLQRERLVGLGLLYDALPQPNWVRLLAKWLALAGLAAWLVGLMGLTCLLIQLTSPLPLRAIEISLYGQDFLVDAWGRQIQLIALTVLFTAWIDQRFWAHAVSVGTLIVLLYGEQSGSIPNRLLFAVLPGSNLYSDLTGYGRWGWLRFLFSAQWTILAILFLGIASLGWSSGLPLTYANWLNRIRTRWSRRYGILFLSNLVLYGMLAFLSYQYDPPINRSIPSSSISGYATKKARYHSRNGRWISVEVDYYHPFQAEKFLQSSLAALRWGEQVMGPYPYMHLRIEEVPRSFRLAIQTEAGLLRLSEQQGWLAKRDIAAFSYIDYIVAREVMGQWWQFMPKNRQKSSSFFTESIPEYLALQAVGKQHGISILSRRLTQLANDYRVERTRLHEWEPTVAMARGQDYVTRCRAGLVFTCLGQVWGDSCVLNSIGYYYQRYARNPVTARHFTTYLASQLPDSLQYLATYLTHRYTFDFHIGRISRQPTDLAVEVFAQKADADGWGHTHQVIFNDWLPIVLLDDEGREQYRQLIRPNPDQSTIRLPLLSGTAEVVVDPLGSWPGNQQRNNRKRF